MGRSKIVAGALAGVLGGVVFGMMMQMMSAPTPDGQHADDGNGREGRSVGQPRRRLAVSSFQQRRDRGTVRCPAGRPGSQLSKRARSGSRVGLCMVDIGWLDSDASHAGDARLRPSSDAADADGGNGKPDWPPDFWHDYRAGVRAAEHIERGKQIRSETCHLTPRSGVWPHCGK